MGVVAINRIAIILYLLIGSGYVFYVYSFYRMIEANKLFLFIYIMKNTRHRRKKRGGNRKTISSTRKKNNTNNNNVNCNTTDEQLSYKSNNIWKTCIRENIIYYITPKNTFIKDIRTILDPKFVVIQNGTSEEYSIQINNEFVSCFLFINGEWYAFVMINFAVLDTFRYYKIDDVKYVYDENGNIVLTNINKFLSNGIIHIKKATEVIQKENPYVYGLMNDFAIQKLLATEARQAPFDAAGFAILDKFLDWK